MAQSTENGVRPREMAEEIATSTQGQQIEVETIVETTENDQTSRIADRVTSSIAPALSALSERLQRLEGASRTANEEQLLVDPFTLTLELPSRFGLRDEARFLRELMRDWRLQVLDEQGLELRLLARYKLLMVKDEYDDATSDRAANLLRATTVGS
ncbi:hypothetical protein J8273_1477 [Carpediemonas membranifera]|uniref:Uncharacterized protein n=1 Tax=Carpediemonas membranifera TaxID=201153 RepID=A0A8J6BA74_9EUKA|nr:hypothetical protein J8273_1477 [Carpediemonas membranifera]|eukprot:KAG9396494.1 hypothetical protein J8273_1477 [Carpediemonas membranifera]